MAKETNKLAKSSLYVCTSRLSLFATAHPYFSPDNVRLLAFFIRKPHSQWLSRQHLEQPQPFRGNARRPRRPQITSLQIWKVGPGNSTETAVHLDAKTVRHIATLQIYCQKLCNHLPWRQRLLIDIYRLLCFVLHSVLTCMRQENANRLLPNTG